MADIVVKTHNGNETYTGIESVTFNTTQEGVKATFIAQKQADWLQNDETAVDYIKNKPFYENGDAVVKLDNKYLNILEEENVNENVLLAEQELDFNSGVHTRYEYWDFDKDTELTVSWDGTEWSVFPQDMSGPYLIGNAALVDAGEDTGEPFAIALISAELAGNGTGTTQITAEDKEATSHAIAVYQAAAATYKINKTYLPDDIGKQSDWNQTDDTAVDFIKNKPEGLATQTYVQEQIAAIDFPEAAEQVQADWNEDDETSKAFVQNRPFYVLGDWVKETTGTFAIDKYAKNNIRSSAVQYGSLSVEGDVFKVIWDGTEYECIATMQPVANFASVGVIGNPKIIVEYYGNQVTAFDTGEPFCFAQGFGNVYTRSAAASHTFRVYYKDNVVKLDEKFIPASVKLPSVTTDDNGKALIVTNGEWVASELEDETQSDWNETDETSKAFILNKPEIPSIEGLATEDFVKEQIAAIEIPEGGGSGGSASTEKVFLEETEIENAFNLDGLIGAQIPFTDCLNIGETYYVNWNSVEYEVTNAQDVTALMQNLIGPTITKAIAMGNGETFGLSGNNEPFTIITTGEVIMFADLSPEAAIGGKNTVRIYQKAPLTVSWENVTDRPFGYETVTIFEGTFQDTLVDNDGDGVNDAWSGEMFLEDTSDANLVVGQTYTYTWGGKEYTSECFVYDTIPVIGNPVVIGGTDDGSPVMIARDGAGLINGVPCWLTLLMSPPTDLTVSGSYNCKILGPSLKRLDNKYLDILEGEEQLYAEVFAEQTVDGFEPDNAGDENSEYIAAIPVAIAIEAGKTYRVVWDGVEYEFMPSNGYLGNIDTADPFCFASVGGETWVITSDQSASHKIRIYQPAINTVAIKEKFIPILKNNGEELIPETTMGLTYESSGSVWAGSNQTMTEAAYNALYSKAGEQVLVMFDGAEYLCNVLLEDESSSIIFLGNVGIFPSATVEDTGEPFYIMVQRTGAEGSYEYVWNIATNEPAPADTSITIEHTVGVILNPGYKIKDEYLSILEGFEDKETEIYPEDTWSTQLEDNFGYALARPFGEELPVFPLTIGDECIVVWDGEEYKVTVGDLSSLMPNVIFVGNGTALELPGNNEPFLIGWDATGVTFAALTDTEPTEHIVRIYQKIEGGYKIKESYIPDSVKLPVATAEDNNKFLRVVDGVPTWVALTDVSIEGA